MKTDGRVLLGSILGKEAESFYVKQMEDFMYFVRSLAFVDTKSEEDKIKEKITNVVSTILQKTVKFFLTSKYGTGQDGSIKVTVIDNEIHSPNGKVVEEIVEFKKSLKTISEQIMELGMDEFEKGRKIALGVTERLKNSINKNKNIIIERDYNDTPPLEAIEIQILKIEKKLPNISKEEGRELSELYELWRQVETNKSSYMENT